MVAMPKRKEPVADPTHNGWTNYPTWAVYTWLTNEEPSYDWARDQADQAKQMPYPKVWLADTLRSQLEEDSEYAWRDGHEASMYIDLLSYALQSVDWFEIAQHLLEED